MVREEIGSRIKKLREPHNFTREELTDKAEISSKFSYEVEKGRKGLSADTLLKLSRTLFCSCDYILTGETFEKENGEQLTQLLQRFTERDRLYAFNILSLMQEMNEKPLFFENTVVFSLKNNIITSYNIFW